MADGKVVIKTDLDSSGAIASAKKLGSGLKTGITAGAKVAVGAIAAVGTATVAATGAIAKMAKDTASTGDHIDKMSQKIGMSAEAYQKWDYIAQISGTSIDGLRMGFKTLTNTIDSAKNGSDKAVAKFEKVGISIDDLKNKSREDIFEQTVKGLQNVSDESERAALANQLLGRAGMELGPLLNSTNQDIDKLMKTAEDYGMIMSDEAVKASAQFTDSLTTMSMTFGGLKNRMSAEFLPALTEVTDGLGLLFKGDTEKGLDKINKGVRDFSDKLISSAPKILNVVKSIVSGFGKGIINNLPTIISTGSSLVISLINGALKAIPKIASSIPLILKTIGEELVKNAPELFASVSDILEMAYNFVIEDLPKYLENIFTFISSIDLADVFSKLLNGDAIGEKIKELAQKIPVMLANLIKSISEFIKNNLPTIIKIGTDLIVNLTKGLLAGIPDLVKALPVVIDNLVDAILDSIPLIIDAGIELITSLVEDLPTIIDTIVEVVPQIIMDLIDSLLDKAPDLLDAGFKLFSTLCDALPKIIPELMTLVPRIIVKLGKALLDKGPELATKGFELFKNLIAKYPKIIAKIVSIAPKIITKLGEKFLDLASKVSEIGKKIVEWIWDGIKDAAGWLWDKLTGFVGDVVDFLGGIFGGDMDDAIEKAKKEADKRASSNKTVKSNVTVGNTGVINTSSMNLQSNLDYSKLGTAVSNALIDADIKVGVNGRDFGRVIGAYQ